MPRGGRRSGAGRPKGVKTARTLEREEARKYLTQRVLSEIEPLATAEIESAKGVLCLYTKQLGRWVRVSDPAIIEATLNTAEKVMGNDYYLIAAKDPDTKALKNIFDREFGKPTDRLEHSGELTLKPPQVIFRLEPYTNG